MTAHDLAAKLRAEGKEDLAKEVEELANKMDEAAKYEKMVKVRKKFKMQQKQLLQQLAVKRKTDEAAQEEGAREAAT